MTRHRIRHAPQVADSEWVAFPGGELEAPRPKALCPECRAKLARAVSTAKSEPGTQPLERGTQPLEPGTQHLERGTRRPAPICFNCHRASVERERTLVAAGNLNTGSEARFQFVLPLEPVNRSRLARLRVERAEARTTEQQGIGRYVNKRRHAQIEARHALERIVMGLRERTMTAEEDRAVTAFSHAAELQLPAAWLPFVLAR